MIARIQRHLEAIYDVEAPDVRGFLVGEPEARALLGEGARPSREWVFVRQDAEGVDIAVYVHAEDLAAVEEKSPSDAVRDALPAFCAVTEGVSHFLLLFRRACREEPVTLLELEAQAEVDKYVTARLHVGPDPTLRRRLFRDAHLAEGLGDEERARYTEAGRLADRYCRGLERLPHVDGMLAELRAFYRQPSHARIRRMRDAA